LVVGGWLLLLLLSPIYHYVRHQRRYRLQRVRFSRPDLRRSLLLRVQERRSERGPALGQGRGSKYGESESEVPLARLGMPLGLGKAAPASLAASPGSARRGSRRCSQAQWAQGVQGGEEGAGAGALAPAPGGAGVEAGREGPRAAAAAAAAATAAGPREQAQAHAQAHAQAQAYGPQTRGWFRTYTPDGRASGELLLAMRLELVELEV
jgi:hypothetical protein